MPYAVTHILIAIIIGSLVRDLFFNKKKFSLHYVLIFGIAALGPDIDLLLYWVLHWFGYNLLEVHRTFSHNLFIPLFFLLAAGATLKLKNRGLGRHHLKVSFVLLAISLGILLHFVLDATLSGGIMPLYPITTYTIGLDVESWFPEPLEEIFLPTLDAIMLVVWLVYLEWKHKISDFI